MTPFEREENYIHDALERGEISREQFWKELKELQRDQRAAAEEAAQEAAREAYENEINRW